MVNNSTNINKTKESLSSDGQQFYQYQQNKRKFNSDGQQFYQYQQNEQPHLTSNHLTQNISLEIQVLATRDIQEILWWNFSIIYENSIFDVKYFSYHKVTVIEVRNIFQIAIVHWNFFPSKYGP